ncbi:MAG: hypothetical protein HY744_18940 [Deltaproteobacteria bacterium]|nr:hypothetical protein [Deltaproteobacteria bacterium]
MLVMRPQEPRGRYATAIDAPAWCKLKEKKRPAEEGGSAAIGQEAGRRAGAG